MSAPPSGLVTALRAGTVRRHLFFKMTHSQGDVLAWDGVGEYELDGEVYLGVRGLASIGGVSNSGELQNQDVTYGLNGVSLPLLNQIDPGIRGEAITLKAAWVSEAGVALYSRTLRTDIADVMTMTLDGETKSVIVKARSPLAEWQTPPRAYYTDNDQQRRFLGDTGFQFVRTLENVTVAGWSSTTESTSGIPKQFSNGGGRLFQFRDHVTLLVVGDHTYGPTAKVSIQSPAANDVRTNTGSLVYKEETTTVVPGIDISTAFMTVGGVNTYIDASGDVRTAGGKRVLISADTTKRLRVQTAIVALGNAGATTLDIQASISHASNSAGPFTVTYARKLGISISGDDMSAVVYDNLLGCCAIVSGGTMKRDNTGGTLYVEDVTGNAITFTGGNVMQVSGANVTVSTTGALRTNAGHGIVKTGTVFADGEFLRIWT